MSSITTLNNSNYYQLSNSSTSSGNTAQSNPTAELLQALSGATDASSSASSSSDAYLLDLSPSAQSYLNGSTSSSTTSNALNPSSSESFTLTSQQQQTIANILAKYKDAPYTQATFDSIQNDLQSAGLDSGTLSRIDQAQNFNPTELFVDDLDGNYNDANAMTNPNETAKSSNYMQNIISEWQTISGNTGASTTDASASGTTATSGT